MYAFPVQLGPDSYAVAPWLADWTSGLSTSSSVPARTLKPSGADHWLSKFTTGCAVAAVAVSHVTISVQNAMQSFWFHNHIVTCSASVDTPKSRDLFKGSLSYKIKINSLRQFLVLGTLNNPG